jgi:hypothetical protein
MSTSYCYYIQNEGPLILKVVYFPEVKNLPFSRNNGVLFQCQFLLQEQSICLSHCHKIYLFHVILLNKHANEEELFYILSPNFSNHLQKYDQDGASQ